MTTTPSPAIAVTGSTGRLGGRVARRLADAGVPQRLVVRRPGAAPDLPGATVSVADYADGDAARAALEGIDTLFMVSAGESADRVAAHTTFLDAAADAGVRHVVYLSFAGAAPDCTFLLGRDHWATEQHLEAGPMAWTMIRDNLYAEDLLMLVGDDGVIRGPGGDGRVAAVAQDDIADAVAAVLADPAAHAGRAYTLTGPEAISMAEAAALISRTTGREVGYVDESLDEARASRSGYGAEPWLVEAWISTYTAMAAGEMAEVTDDVARLTGHPATPAATALQRATP